MSLPNQLQVIPDDQYDRRKFLGGSNAAAILGLDAFGNTPLTTYLAKIGDGQEQMDEKQRLFLTRRKRWEPVIVEMLREEFDGQIVAINRRYRDAEHDFLAAEIDWEWVDGHGRLQNGETKTVSPFAFGERFGWGDPGTGDIPVHYAAQVVHGLGVTGRDCCIVAAMVGLDTMVFYRIDRDPETIANMRQVMVAFWTQHVLPLVPPDPISFEDSLRLAMRMKGRPVEIDEHISGRLEQLRTLRSSRRAFEEDEVQIKFEILEYLRRAWGLVGGEAGDEIKENALLTRGGTPIASYNMQKARRIDVDALRAERPDIAADFTVESPSRVLRFAKRGAA